jgi:uncharacterized protein YbjT (DUF2867 family)
MIVVTCPTGLIGRQVLDLLLDAAAEARRAAAPVRVVTRDPTRLDPWALERVETVAGSHGDAAVLDAAFPGADSVFLVVPPNPHGSGAASGYYLGFARPAAEAVAKYGVKRLVAVTSLGHGYRGEAGQLGAAMAMDEVIEGSGVAYRALAAAYFMENLLGQAARIREQGVFSLANDADRPLATVATRDVAAVAAQLLIDATWNGQKSIPVAGPQDHTPREMAHIVSEVLERPVRFEQATPEQYQSMLTGYGIDPAWSRGLVDTVRAQNDGLYDAEPHADSFLEQPTSFREWCELQLKPAVRAR